MFGIACRNMLHTIHQPTRSTIESGYYEYLPGVRQPWPLMHAISVTNDLAVRRQPTGCHVITKREIIQEGRVADEKRYPVQTSYKCTRVGIFFSWKCFFPLGQHSSIVEYVIKMPRVSVELLWFAFKSLTISDYHDASLRDGISCIADVAEGCAQSGIFREE